MDKNAYLLFVFNTHMPYVRNPSIEHPAEETWLYEAVLECYLPLLEVFSRLVEDGVNFQISISLNPCLIQMLSDPLMQDRCLAYIDERIELAEREMSRLSGSPEFYPLARFYRERFRHLRDIYAQVWGKDLVGAFRSLRSSGKVDILASGATHAYLPLWDTFPQLVDLQVKLGVLEYERSFGSSPLGFWLPECAFYPGLDQILARRGIRYFYLDAHGLLNGFPRPVYGVYAPVHCPAGVAAFGRDWTSHDLVWLKDRGYPGDPAYLNYDRDIGFELPVEYIAPFTHQDKAASTGIKYYRNPSHGWSGVYDPQAAFARCDDHADHFFHKIQHEARQINGALGKKPVLVALFDTEHFGHWWREGPIWLDLVIRKLAYDQQTVQLASAAAYLREHPTNQVVMPSMSSWGYQGYNETWLMGRNHWIYPELYQAAEVLQELIALHANPQEEICKAFNQYLRELLIGMSSDWAFILHNETTMDYATQRVRTALENMRAIAEQIRQCCPDGGWLSQLRAQNSLFADLDLLAVYQS